MKSTPNSNFAPKIYTLDNGRWVCTLVRDQDFDQPRNSMNDKSLGGIAEGELRRLLPSNPARLLPTISYHLTNHEVPERPERVSSGIIARKEPTLDGPPSWSVYVDEKIGKIPQSLKRWMDFLEKELIYHVLDDLSV